MNVTYLLNGLKLNEKEKEYLEKKLAKVNRFFRDYHNPDELRVKIDINQDKKSFWIVEIMLETPTKIFRVVKNDKDFMTAVDLSHDALLKQLRRFKDKLITLRRRR